MKRSKARLYPRIMALLAGLAGIIVVPAASAVIIASDDFTSGGYSGGTGWSGNWLETATNNPNTGPACSGNGYSNDNRICRHSSGTFRFHGVSGPDPYIYRQLDLSQAGIQSASLIFDLVSTGNLSGLDSFSVQASGNGGATWTEIASYNDDVNLSSIVLDLTPYLSGNTSIRFGVAAWTNSNGEGYQLDNVQIDVEYELGADDFGITNPDTAINLSVLDNDGADADPATVRFPAQSVGTVSGGGSILTVPNEGVYTVQGDGSVTFSPVSGFSGRSTRVVYEVDNNAGTLTASAEIQVLINERHLCAPATDGNLGFALASPGDGEVHIVELSDPGNPNPDLNPGNTELLFSHNTIAAAQNGDGDPSNDIPYLGSLAGPAPDGSVVSDPVVGAGGINAMAVDSMNERLYYTSNSGAGDNRTVFVYDGPTQRIGRFIIDVTDISSSECPGGCDDLTVAGNRGLNDAGAEYHAGRLFLGVENYNGSNDRIFYIDLDEVDARVNGTFPPRATGTGIVYTFADTSQDWGDLVVKAQVGVTNPGEYYLYSIDRVGGGGQIYRIVMDNDGPPYVADQVVSGVTGQGSITQGDYAFVFNTDIRQVDLDTGAQIGSPIPYSGAWPGSSEAFDATSCVSPTSSLPVSLNSFESRLFGNRLDVEWTTASETFNAGFAVWAKVDDEWRLITPRTVVSGVTDAVTPQEYKTTIRLSDIDPRAIEGLALSSIDTTGSQELYGSFEIGKSYGEKLMPEPIPWRDIRAEYETRMTNQGYVKQGRKWYRNARQESDKRRRAYRSALEKARARFSALFGDDQGSSANGSGSVPEQQRNRNADPEQYDVPSLEVSVTRPGMQRLRFEDLLGAGVDLSGVRANAIAVTLKGEAVPRHIEQGSGNGGLGPGGYIDFWGVLPDYPDALYLSEYIYRIEVDPSKARLAGHVQREARRGQAVALHPVRVNEDLAYSFSTATEDPWYAAMLRYPWGPLDYTATVNVDDALAADRPGRVEVVVTARTSFPEVNPDHRIRVRVNGQVVLEREADGNRALTLTGEVPAGVLAPGGNTVTVELPGGTAAPFEIVLVDRVALWYPRALAAVDNRLHMEDDVTASGLQGSGFDRDDLVAYATDGKGNLGQLQVHRRPDPAWTDALTGVTERIWALRAELWWVRRDRDARDRLVGLLSEAQDEYRRLQSNRSWTAVVPTVSRTPGVEGVEYWLSTTSGLNRPQVLGTVQEEDLLADAADFLLIVHPSFMPESGEGSHPLNRYMDRRQSQGWRVRAVALDAIQNAYGGGMALPGALTSFLAAADAAFDYSHVLLVGDDSYDYLDNLGLGSVSFVPTMYTKANVINFSPSDGLLTDLDGDGLSDKAVGRWPVRTLTDLEVMVQKTLDWEDSVSGPRDARTSVWVTDSEDPAVASFEAQAERMIGTLQTPLAGGGGEPWPAEQISRVYFDEVSAEAGLSVAQTARGELMEALSAGQTVTGFVGHGSPTAWTFQGLLGPQHVSEMDNEGRPTLITTLTCYTSYFVSPNTDTLAHRLMKGYRKDGQGNEIPGVANGAVAVHGAATLSGYTDNESLARRTLAHQLQDGDTLGEAIRKARVAAFEAGQLDTAKNWALLGDPTLTIGQ
ncbi:MAG: C25 family cysteine peptidase [Gammaproteobacteria bacterium]|nr:C25 family cysteine peptidase [Gammaproteobacteria bacterium]